MCYSAQIRADYRTYVRLFGAHVSIKEFYETFFKRRQDGKLKIPKAMEAAFDDPQTPEEREIKVLIDEYKLERTVKLEQELFKQRKRLADAERKLQVKLTKTAAEERRIATNNIADVKGWLDDLRRKELLDRDSRIFPGYYAPIMAMQDGEKVIVPMRYQCRPQGMPPSFDKKLSGTYNARRDNLEGFWKGQFGYSHGIMIVDRFYENVNRHKMEHRDLREGEEIENVVLKFDPTPSQEMFVACLWSRWTAPGQPDLLSFAAITDEPPEEVAAAGHDRCIIPIRRENVDAWLNPDPKNLAALHAILDDRERPYYEHRIAA